MTIDIEQISGSEQRLWLPNGDHPLAGSLFAPRNTLHRVVVLHSATGVPQGFYASFARWLSDEHAAVVLTYDYRDFGRSATGPLRRSDATMADWGVRDQSAALDWLCEAYPGLPVWVVGHSLGGLYVSWHAKADRIQKMVAVGAGPAWFRRHPWHYMPQVFAFWFLAGPALTWAIGYLPGRALGLGADLPAGVYWQWRRWCLRREFNRGDYGTLLPHPDLDALTAKLRIVGIADDVMVTPAMTRCLKDSYPSAEIEEVTVHPSDAGQRAIGHLRVFSERCSRAWPLLIG